MKAVAISISPVSEAVNKWIQAILISYLQFQYPSFCSRFFFPPAQFQPKTFSFFIRMGEWADTERKMDALFAGFGRDCTERLM